MIVEEPEQLANQYEELWYSQLSAPRSAYDRIRAGFNRTREPAKLLYLLARCVKNAVRFNSSGEFNQSPDNRRLGMNPSKMRREIFSAHWLLSGRTTVLAADYILLTAGRSAQATLLGRNEVTVESLYLSPALQERIAHEGN